MFEECYPSNTDNVVNNFVEKMMNVLSIFSGRKFSSHDVVSVQNRTNSYSSTSQLYNSSIFCDGCSLNCNGLFLREMQSVMDFYPQFVETTLIEHKLNLDYEQSKLGILHVLSSIVDIKTNHKDLLPSYSLEMGGGGGLGFQLFCDNRLVISSGGGGGGGLYYNSSISVSNNRSNFVDFGGGGGAGMQLTDGLSVSDHKTKFVNIGGGGGCGSASNTSHTLSNLQISCGYNRDDDSLTSASDLHALLSSRFSREQFRRECRSVSVSGGGGGGGGTGGCCAPFTAGYGFSFSLSSTDDDDAVPSRSQKPPLTVSRENVQHHSFNRTDLSSELLRDAAIQCGEDADNWCCVCSAAQDRILACLSDNHVPSSSSSAQVSCGDIDSHRHSVQWMQWMPCCKYYNHTFAPRHRHQSFSQSFSAVPLVGSNPSESRLLSTSLDDLFVFQSQPREADSKASSQWTGDCTEDSTTYTDHVRLGVRQYEDEEGRFKQHLLANNQSSADSFLSCYSTDTGTLSRNGRQMCMQRVNQASLRQFLLGGDDNSTSVLGGVSLVATNTVTVSLLLPVVLSVALLLSVLLVAIKLTSLGVVADNSSKIRQLLATKTQYNQIADRELR